jgi:hypothetical protein
MSRRLDWDRTKWPRGREWITVSEVTDELPGVPTPNEAKRDYIRQAVAAAVKGQPPPTPTPIFLRYFKTEFPNGSIEEWLITEPTFRAELDRCARAKKLNRKRYLAKLAEIEGAFVEPHLPPASLGEIEGPETPDKIWAWAHSQPEYSDLLKKTSRRKGRFN